MDDYISLRVALLAGLRRHVCVALSTELAGNLAKNLSCQLQVNFERWRGERCGKTHLVLFRETKEVLLNCNTG